MLLLITTNKLRYNTTVTMLVKLTTVKNKKSITSLRSLTQVTDKITSVTENTTLFQFTTVKRKKSNTHILLF